MCVLDAVTCRQFSQLAEDKVTCISIVLHIKVIHSHPNGLVLLKLISIGKFQTKCLLGPLPLLVVCVIPSDTPCRGTQHLATHHTHTNTTATYIRRTS